MAPVLVTFVSSLLVSVLGGLLLGNVFVVLLGTVVVRRRRIGRALPPRHEVAMVEVPGPALGLLFERDLSPSGFAALGYLTGPPQFGLWGYQQCWVDASDLHTCAAVIARKLSARSKAVREVALVTPATIDGRPVVLVTSDRVGPAEPGDASLLTVELPGAEPAALLRAHRLRIAELVAVPSQVFTSLAEVNALLMSIGERSLQLAVERGRLEMVANGVVRLSWGASVRAGAGATPIARRLRKRRAARSNLVRALPI